jgi:hypothetical protein
MLAGAVRGEFPAADGSTHVLASPPGPVDAVVAFTAHHVVAAGVREDEVRARLRPGDLAAAMEPSFLAWLAERLRTRAGMSDLVLVADPAGPGELDVTARDDLAAHPRVARAAAYRRALRVWSDGEGHGVLILGRGLAKRLEVAVEVDEAARGRGLGRRLAFAARALAGAEPVFAQVTPGNVASLRAFLAAGYRPIGSEVLFLKNDEGPPLGGPSQ